jgi:hypothetical protein
MPQAGKVRPVGTFEFARKQRRQRSDRMQVFRQVMRGAPVTGGVLRRMGDRLVEVQTCLSA